MYFNKEEDKTARKLKDVDVAIAGGGENGAYGAGLLCGWSELGTRPSFNVVTGVSTGALTAPFAFLGSDYDDALKTCYTTLSTSELVTERGLLEGLTGDAMSDPDGLLEMLSTQFDEAAYRRMGEEHLKGRRLFVGTTNLDRMEPAYWCLSAIAAEDLPGGRELALDIILASASSPSSAAHTVAAESAAASVALVATCWIETSISVIAEEVSSAVEESASILLATSLTEKVICSIDTAVSCTDAARLNMLSDTSSLAAAISKIELEDSSAFEASSSTLPAIFKTPAL